MEFSWAGMGGQLWSCIDGDSNWRRSGITKGDHRLMAVRVLEIQTSQLSCVKLLFVEGNGERLSCGDGWTLKKSRWWRLKMFPAVGA